MENWIAEAVGKMHVHRITQIELAKNLGVTNRYLSAIFNGKRNPKNAKERILAAIDDLIASKV